MGNFILEEELENVKSRNTQGYLMEVMSTYYSGNYRSCIVSLYTIVIYDFIEKIIKLKEVYSDNKAGKWLIEIDDMQKKDEKYSAIESKVFEAIIDIQILSSIEIEQVKFLKQARNSAAHPVFHKKHPVQAGEYILVTPTKEQTISHIRNMFDAVFTKDIVLSKKILEEFRTDICAFYERHPDLEGLNIFIYDKYYKYFNTNIKEYIFEELWKYAFVFKDQDCDKNRRVLVETLLLFMEKDKHLYLEYLRKNKEKLYGKVDFNESFYKTENLNLPEELRWRSYRSQVKDMYDLPIKSLIYFLKINREFYELAPERVKTSINNICKSDINIYLFSDFISKTREEHIIGVFDKIEKSNNNNPCLNVALLLSEYERCKAYEMDSLMRKKISWYYSNNTYSNTYGYDFEYINEIFSNILTKVLPDYTSTELIELLDLVGNRGTYREADSNMYLKAQINDLICNKKLDVDCSKYYIMS